MLIEMTIRKVHPMPSFALVLAIVFSALFFSTACSKSAEPSVLHTPAVNGEGFAKIQHIIFIIKENRSFDSYFGSFPGADGAISGRTSNGTLIPLTPTPDRLPFDLGHRSEEAIRAIDGGKMDGFDLLDNGNVDGAMLPYSQMREEDISNYFAYARNFVLA